MDSSNIASAGGEFIRDGELWRMQGTMVARLAPGEIETSSTYRELLGVLRLDITAIPDACRKALVALDSQAAVHCLLHGSKVPGL